MQVICSNPILEYCFLKCLPTHHLIRYVNNIRLCPCLSKLQVSSLWLRRDIDEFRYTMSSTTRTLFEINLVRDHGLFLISVGPECVSLRIDSSSPRLVENHAQQTKDHKRAANSPTCNIMRLGSRIEIGETYQ